MIDRKLNAGELKPCAVGAPVSDRNLPAVGHNNPLDNR